MAKLYNWCLKQLLVVRKFTCNDMCYAESGYPPLKDRIEFKQHTFYRAMWQERSAYDDDPLFFVLNLVKVMNTATGKLLRESIKNNVKDLSVAMESVKSSIANSDSSRRVTYRNINPNLVVHDTYKSKPTINENYRLAFTKFRVSGHSLLCETGRWNRRGRDHGNMET